MSERKRALVTGSTSGIGQATARALAFAGCDVVLNGFGDEDVIERDRAALAREAGVEVAFAKADLMTVEGCEDLFHRIGGVDVLVNNAGIQHVAPVDEFPPEAWDRVISLNLSAVFHMTRLALPGMKARNWGRVINIASAHGLVASPYKAAYVAAKHGVVGLTKVTALEVAKTAITCNAICPGWVRTPLVEQQIEKRAQEQGKSIEEATDDLLGEKHPTGRFVEPSEIGGLAVYLVGDAARNVTGASLSIDGAWTAQ